MSTDVSAMHANPSSGEIVCACGCGRGFTPRKPWQRFYSTKCRNDWNAKARESGLRGVVSSVRMLRRGGVSITLRFTATERDRASQFEPGKVIEVL